MKAPKVKNPPESIYLNVGDLDGDCEFGDLYASEVTWCEDQMSESDIEYRIVKRRSKANRLSEP